MTSGAELQDESARGAAGSTVFVSDPSVEAERVAAALRAASFTVVDVPLSMLVARVAVQRPRVILVDADADGALDAVARMRELPDADAIDVVFFARAGAGLATTEEALAHEASGFFRRPVEIEAVVAKIQSLTGVVGASPKPSRPPRPPSGPPPSIPVSSLSASLPPASMRLSEGPSSSRPPSAGVPLPPPSAARLSQRPSLPVGDAPPSQGDPAKRVHGAPLSAELEQLLAEAEQRVPVQASPESVPPTPEEEIEAVLPAELLEALDQPIEEEDDDEPAQESVYQPGARHAAPARPVTSASGPPPATGTGTGVGSSSSGGGGTGAGTGAGTITATGAAQRAVAASALTPAPHHKTHGGTHSGSTSTTGERARSDSGSSAVVAPVATSSGAKDAQSAVVPEPKIASMPPPTASSLSASRDEGTGLESIRLRAAEVAAPQPQAIAPTVITPGEAPRLLARAIATRATGALAFDTPDGVRRLVLREGDLVTAASGIEDESLVAFLGARGELPREIVKRVAGKFPPFGRHAGAALVAHGYLRQDQLWPILRAHAEWVLARMMDATTGSAVFEAEPPGRLRTEPGVFGGSTGAEVYVEVLRRLVAPEIAIDRLGGPASRIGDGENAALMSECALGARELDLLAQARGRSIAQVLDAAPDSDLATVVYALWLLGVFEVMRAVGKPAEGRDGADARVDALDEEAIRARVRARTQLIDEADYFAVLGVPKTATGYEIRRAFLELRRAFDPSRILTPEVADLGEDVQKIVLVLEEAYEILRDTARRERYRRAIDANP